MGTEVSNNLPGFIKEIDYYKVFKKRLKLFLHCHHFYSLEEFVSSSCLTYDIYIYLYIYIYIYIYLGIQNINRQFMNYM